MMATNDGLLFALKLVSALGCGLIAGVFFAFSSFVMKALGRLAPAEGMAPEAAKLWVDYLVSWTAWNHVRTVAALLAAASFAISLRY